MRLGPQDSQVRPGRKGAILADFAAHDASPLGTWVSDETEAA
jgi:hypothetical protein